jgi:hypothetical protein
VRPDGAPEDYNEDDAVDEYYERKMKHREEMLRPLSWVFAIGLLLVALALFFSSRSEAQDPPVPLEEPCPSSDCTVYNQAFLYALTGDERMIKWALVQSDVDTMDLFTEITVFEFPPKAVAFPVMKAELAEIEREIGWTPNRAGTYFVSARACRTDGDLSTEPDAEPHPTHGTVLCSILISSLDPAHVDPTVYPRGFVMLIKLAPATGGGIE